MPFLHNHFFTIDSVKGGDYILLSPKVSGTQNGGTVPYKIYKAVLGGGFPLRYLNLFDDTYGYPTYEHMLDVPN